jgi:FlaA1/EpsC-like NDP-sugar epimerase
MMLPLHEMNLKELLGRDAAKIDLEGVRPGILGRRVMVTGAAGSIGSELCSEILKCGPAQLVCVDRAETELFCMRQRLLRSENISQVMFAIADAGHRPSMQRLLFRQRPEIIFHAAAYKHVLMTEENVPETVQNNALCVVSLVQLAEAAGSEVFVLISSDKAVNPTSVMGATKRICEMVLASRPSPMRCISVRFGNVLGSGGSVVPILCGQLENNQPLTITHPEMKRFFMSVREAVLLVLKAGMIGKQGDILVLEMGEPVRIIDLARRLIRLSGKDDQDVEIQFTGIRKGEKLQEEFFSPNELALPTVFPNIKCAFGPSREWGELNRQLEELKESLLIDDDARLKTKLKAIVPEYCPPEPRSANKA